MNEQAKAFRSQLPVGGQQKFHLIHDHDSKFSAAFREARNESGVILVKLPICSPNLNARCERVIQTIKYECLHHFMLFGQKHLNYLLSRFVEHYNEHCAHSSLNFRPPACSDPPPENNEIDLDEVVCREALGGLLKSYERRAAQRGFSNHVLPYDCLRSRYVLNALKQAKSRPGATRVEHS